MTNKKIFFFSICFLTFVETEEKKSYFFIIFERIFVLLQKGNLKIKSGTKNAMAFNVLRIIKVLLNFLFINLYKFRHQLCLFNCIIFNYY